MCGLINHYFRKKQYIIYIINPHIWFFCTLSGSRALRSNTTVSGFSMASPDGSDGLPDSDDEGAMRRKKPMSRQTTRTGLGSALEPWVFPRGAMDIGDGLMDVRKMIFDYVYIHRML